MRHFLCGLLAILAVICWACSPLGFLAQKDRSTNIQLPTPTSFGSPAAVITPTTNGPALTPFVIPVATPSKVISSSTAFESKIYNYTLKLPVSWYGVSGGIISAGVRGDVFYPRKPGVEAYITVFAEDLNPSVNLDSYVDASVNNISRIAGVRVQKLGDYRGGLISGQWLAWTDFSKSPEVFYIRQLVWIYGGKAWVMTLRSKRKNLSSYGSVLEFMAATWRAE